MPCHFLRHSVEMARILRSKRAGQYEYHTQVGANPRPRDLSSTIRPRMARQACNTPNPYVCILFCYLKNLALPRSCHALTTFLPTSQLPHYFKYMLICCLASHMAVQGVSWRVLLIFFSKQLSSCCHICISSQAFQICLWEFTTKLLPL